jgi:hypothetical protein
LFKSNSFNRSSGFTLLAIWGVALCVVIYYTAKTTAQFRTGANIEKTVSIKPSSVGTYYLKLNDIKYLSREDSIRLNVKERFNGMIIIDNDDDDFTELDSRVYITIERSDIATPVLVESFSARGSDYEEALSNARNTTYQFVQQDSVLKFPRSLEKQHDKLWRNQELHLTLKLPLNTKLVIDQELDHYLNGIDVYDCKVVNKKEEASTANFIMTANGLECKVDTLLIPPPIQDSVIIKKDTIITKKP